MLHGRADELAALTERLDRAAAGRGSAVLVHGDPGIGKTSVLRAIADVAHERGFTVVHADGVEAELDVPYAVLRRLVEPLLGLRDRLPPAQSQALGSSLGLEPPTPYERFAIPAALLGLLELAAADAPVLAVVDDLQWVDPASRETLVFAARRLAATPAALVLGARDEDGGPIAAPGVDRLALAPLDPASAREVLARRPRPLAPAVIEQVADAAAGNPLALVEIVGTLTPEQRSGRAPLETPLRLGPMLEEAFARRTTRLAEDARRAITVAAAMESGGVGWLLDALSELGLGEPALDAAERSRTLAIVDGRVAFRHPLVRAAAYHAAGDGERRDAHRALAATAGDPARRAWHLAAAAHSADASVAAALEEAARHARSVGGHAEAASAFERAAELSPGDHERGRRELEAAHDLLTAGETERAWALVRSAEARVAPEERPRLARLRGNVALRLGDADGATRELSAEAERRLAAGALDEAAAVFLEASVGPLMTGDLESQVELVKHALTATGPGGGELRTLGELMVGVYAIVRGHDAAGDQALAALEPRLAELRLLDASELVALAAQASLWIGERARAERILDRLLGEIRQASALGRLPYPLSVHAMLEFRRGRVRDAVREAHEAVQLATDTRQDGALAFTLTVASRFDAAVGDLPGARAAIDHALRLCSGEQYDGLAIFAHGARTFAELVAGEPEVAIEAARAAAAIQERRGFRQRAATTASGDVVEALVLAGRRDEAAQAAGELAAWAEEAGSAWGAVAASRGHVLVAGPDDVDACAHAATEAAARLDDPFEQARTELAIGDRLHRLHRRPEARERLDRALTGFERLGAEPFARRARERLEAAGTSRRSETAGALGALTPEERRIVALVTEGRTNREIAAELYLGEKTLERRLTALYRRLGIASRIELARLAGGD